MMIITPEQQQEARYRCALKRPLRQFKGGILFEDTLSNETATVVLEAFYIRFIDSELPDKEQAT